jgi:hypothetical protein
MRVQEWMGASWLLARYASAVPIELRSIAVITRAPAICIMDMKFTPLHRLQLKIRLITKKCHCASKHELIVALILANGQQRAVKIATMVILDAHNPGFIVSSSAVAHNQKIAVAIWPASAEKLCFQLRLCVSYVAKGELIRSLGLLPT